jgi:hypothetical protein
VKISRGSVRSVTAVGLTVAAVVAALGCGTKVGGPVVGSCDEPDRPGNYSGHTCADYHDTPLLKRTCTATGSKIQTTPCDRTGAIGACKSTYTEVWHYNRAIHADEQALSKLCGREGMLLPNGTTFTPKSASAENADKAKASLAKDGAKAKTSLAIIAAIAAKKLPAPTGKVNIEGLTGSALVVHAEDLADPEHPKALPYRLAGSDRLASCSRLLNSRPTPNDDGDALYYCAQPVLAVVSVTSLKKPASTGTTQSGNTKTTLYSKGRITGDVLFFRTDTGKYLGSFGFDAENDQMPPFATTAKLEADLWEEFASSLTRHAHKDLPGLLSSFSVAK